MAKAKYRDNNVGIDYSGFQRKAKALVKVWKLEEKDFIKDQSRLLARDAARWTPPWSGGKKAFSQLQNRKGTAIASKADIEAGENAIKGDIKRICYVVRDRTVWEWREKYGDNALIYNKLGVPVARGVITNGTKLYRWHQDNKRKDGRTKDNLKPPNMPAVGRELINEYIKDMQKHVGVAKASLLKTAMSFGDKGSGPAKIKRHVGKATGSGRLITTQKGTEGLLSARADGLYRTNQLVPHLMRNRLEKALKRLQILAKAAAKKAKLKIH